MMYTKENLTRRGVLKIGAAVGVAGSVLVYPGRQIFAASNEQLDLGIERTRIVVDGVDTNAIAIGGSVPAPTLRWQEGDDVTIHVTNRLDEPTSIHWHGLLLEGVMDGAPGFNGYVAIEPGETYTYRFRLRQSGTYWYHSHSALQEQAGMYGAIVIEPSQREPAVYDRDHVVLLSDHSQERPIRILRNLKADPEYYNRGRRTLLDFFDDADRDGLGTAFDDRLGWGAMRMDPTDLADVSGYTFLVNGKGPSDNWTGLFTPGDRVRLRIINGSAASFFDVRIPDLSMTVVAADGQNVVPVPVDEFRIGVGETYDVIVHPRDTRAYTIFAEPIDRSGYARATLATQIGAAGEIPTQRPRTTLTMADMAMAQVGMDHATMSNEMSSAADIDHAAMGHTMPMEDNIMAMDTGDTRRPLGWADAGTPAGAKALTYQDLRAASINRDPREPNQEIEIQLTGIMDRYIWTLNGERFDEGDPIRVAFGDRIRLRFVNQTMMAHPMHLHGMFMELENGQNDRKPLKHVVIVPPGQSTSVVLTADEPGDWPFHCHVLYHMASGMMTRFIVESRSSSQL